MKHIYLSGGWGYGNKGDNAILDAMLQSIGEHLPEARVTITSYDTKEIRDLHNLDSIESIHSLFFRKKTASALNWLALGAWILTNNKITLTKDFKSHINTIKDSSIVVMGGGGYFNDAWPNMLKSKYLEIYIAHRLKKPIMMYGQTIGPFNKKTITKSLSKTLKKVDFIAYRDEQSATVLNLCDAIEKSALTADEVNLLKKHDKLENKEKNKKIGVMIQNLRPHSGVHGPSRPGHITTEKQYINEVVNALKAVDQQLQGITVQIIPSTSWDQGTCNKVFSKLSDLNINASKINTDTAGNFVSACREVDVMLSTNMHPIILAATAAKPSIALSYHYKLDDYMQSIGLEEFNLRIDDFTARSLADKVIRTLEERAQLELTIKKQHSKIKELALQNVQALKRITESKI